MKVPDQLAHSIRARWPERAESWLARVGPELDELTRQHSATPQRVLPARYAFVVSAISPDAPLIFRASADPAALEQAAVAEVLGRLGVGPMVHCSTSTNTGLWTVMDQVVPGTPLADADPRSLDIDALAQPLRVLAGQRAPRPDLPHISDWLRARLIDDNLSDLPSGEQVAHKGERVGALRILNDLTSDMLPGLCHGDASPWNVLAGHEGRWTLIDPRGMQGEVEYDAAVVAYKLGRFLTVPDAEVKVAEASGLALDRIAAWTLVGKAARV